MHETTSRRFESFRTPSYCFEPLRPPYSYRASLRTHVSIILHTHGTHYGYYGHQVTRRLALYRASRRLSTFWSFITTTRQGNTTF